MGADDSVNKMVDICDSIPDSSRVGKESNPINNINVS